MRVTASVVLSYVKCPREAWFISRDIIPDQNNPFIELGRFIHERYYQDMGERSVDLPGMKMDIIWREGKLMIVGEIKKSSKAIDAARAQLLYYLYALKKLGIRASGYVLIPKERKKIKIELTKKEIEFVENLLEEVEKTISMDIPPEVERKPICASCGYRELCWA